MTGLTAGEAARIAGGAVSGNPDIRITGWITDSRSWVADTHQAFIALHGPNHDAHQFIPQLIRKGVRIFICDRDIDVPDPDRAVIRVRDTLDALQSLAAHYRRQFGGQVIAITGSNGKTIVKEWVAAILSRQFRVSKSPKSYNSQVGVALSILQADPDADYYVFEAGISRPGEMDRLEEMLRPDTALITNLGDAHQENFTDRQQKLNEKLLLFRRCKQILYCRDHTDIHHTVQSLSAPDKQLISWGRHPDATIRIQTDSTQQTISRITANPGPQPTTVSIPFVDQASLENACHALCLSLQTGMDKSAIREAMKNLEPVAMRLQQVRGVHGCTLINDSYNSDYQSVQNAIDVLWQQSAQTNKTLILTDLQQTGDEPAVMVNKLKKIMEGKLFRRILGIGPVMVSHGVSSGLADKAWPDTPSFLRDLQLSDFHDEAILLKGARIFELEKIKEALEEQQHRTVLRIHMPTLLHNLNRFREILPPDTRIMGMVKAFSYGSGTWEIARYLAHQQIDYLAVAFIDEGVQLRKAGVQTPIMVMNPDFSRPAPLLNDHLEPEVFSPAGLRLLLHVLEQEGLSAFPVHLKVDTGMHRLGFSARQLRDGAHLLTHPAIRIVSVFSHLAAAGDPAHDAFTHKQIRHFNERYDEIAAWLGYKPLKHLLNSAGIERFREARFDMVRLGIGLYGFGNGDLPDLESPLCFQSYISQIHEVEAGETIGYDRMGRMPHTGRIGIVPVGYADGFDRRLGNGNWWMQIGDDRVPTIGQICMDMCMIDLSKTQAEEGDLVTILKGRSGILDMAAKLQTIPYEIITGFSSRINRIFEFE